MNQPPSEALTHDWNKYRPDCIAVGGVDHFIRILDIRFNKGPVAILGHHDYAVRKVAWSPHAQDLLLSASYDMSCRVWLDRSEGSFEELNRMSGPDIGANQNPYPDGRGGVELGRMGRHTEFVTGVDWCLFGAEGWCASVGWDERVLVWDVGNVINQNGLPR
jgi:peroxin-7